MYYCYVSIQSMLERMVFFISSLSFLTLSILRSSNNRINLTESKIENDKRISVLVGMWQTKIDINIYQYK